MSRKTLFCIVIFCLTALSAPCQSRQYAYSKLNDLTSKRMHGRGYVKNGSMKAARYIERELKHSGLQSFGNSFHQDYSFNINTFPSKMEVILDDRILTPGLDYVVHPSCQSKHEKFELLLLPDSVSSLEQVYKVIDTNLLDKKIVVFPASMSKYYMRGIAGIDNAIFLNEKIFWHQSHAESSNKRCYISMQSQAFDSQCKTATIHFKSKLIQNFKSRNIIAYVPGCGRPDSLIVFTAHFDHLGMMGSKTMFAGANDNASGTAFLLDLARYYAQHPQDAYYSMVFIFLSGEETGLYGSTYNALHPLFDLAKVRLLLNFDMVGTGSEGITLVNGKEYPHIAATLIQLNDEQHLIPDIQLRAQACNSDHCPYYNQGVPAFFIYTRGKENLEYHTVTDTPEKLPFTIYEPFFKLICSFVEQVRQPIFNR